MNIVIVKDLEETVTQAGIERIKKINPKAHVVLVKDSANDVNRALNDAEVLLTPNATLLSIDATKAPMLQWIHVTSAGVETLPQFLFDSKISITNSSGVHPIPIAEQVFTYMLLFARQMNQTILAQKQKKWMEWGTIQNIFELHGRTIGIVGFGRIGKEVAELAKAFSMPVIAVTRDKHKKEKNVDELLTIENLDKPLTKADFIINCLPQTKETLGLFDLNKFKKMKKTAYFINIGRGKVVNEKDLIATLKQKHIAGAGLDVFETEPLPKTSPLWSFENVILTPHSAGFTPEYTKRVIEIFCDNLQAYVHNKPMPTLVDKKRGY